MPTPMKKYGNVTMDWGRGVQFDVEGFERTDGEALTDEEKRYFVAMTGIMMAAYMEHEMKGRFKSGPPVTSSDSDIYKAAVSLWGEPSEWGKVPQEEA